MAINPVGVGATVGGTLASIMGNMISQDDALKNAQADAAAKNSVLAGKVSNLNDLYNTNNAPTFSALAGSYAPDAQASQLSTAQGARGTVNAANIPQDSPDSILLDANGSPATKQAYAQQMGKAFNYATNQAKAQGNLSGYNDTWLQNSLNNDKAQRNLSVSNSLAEGQKALINPEQQNASNASYTPPSVWGPLLSGAGTIAASAGGANLLGSLGGAAGATGGAAAAGAAGAGEAAAAGGGSWLASLLPFLAL